MNDSMDDAALVTRAKAGEMAAFEALVVRHEQRVYSLVLRMVRQVEDAQDVTQQTFLSVLEHLDHFRGESSFATWISRIATHAALKVIRKRQGLEMVSLEQNTEPQEGAESIPHPEYIADWRETPGELVERQEARQLIDEALARLDEKHRLVFVLRDVEGLSIQETARELGISENNVKIRLLRARLQLREMLTQKFGDPATRLVHH
jgi:RNA polymerase sigma-70 factor (ECF subfamily)